MFLKFEAGGGYNFSEKQANDFFGRSTRKISPNAGLPLPPQLTILFHNLLRGAQKQFLANNHCYKRLVVSEGACA